MADQKSKPTAADYEKLGRSVEAALINDYINWLGNTKRQIFQALIRGIFTGLGTVIGATIVVGLVVWILHLLGGVPVVGEFLKATGNQIQQ
jgi:hypothetical protein